jgi:hypothetical protein
MQKVNDSDQDHRFGFRPLSSAELNFFWAKEGSEPQVFLNKISECMKEMT